MSYFKDDAIFWLDVDKIKPNPYQPRREFNQFDLESLADTIRQYGLMQAVTVTRKEVPTEDGGLTAEYELISGERRLRACKIAGLAQIPAVVKTEEDSDQVKLELAIIENVQREDLNVVDRARSFQQLIDEFGLKHIEVGKKVGKSRVYVSNSLRILQLPEEIVDALGRGEINEGHTRPLLMLTDRAEEQDTLFREIMLKKLNVRDAERIARRIAYDKVRKPQYMADPELVELEEKLAENLGTRVHVEKGEKGGKLHIDFFSAEDLQNILKKLETGALETQDLPSVSTVGVDLEPKEVPGEAPAIKAEEPQDLEDPDLYSLKNFSI